MLRYAILGPVELCNGERALPVGGPRQVALLALLLVNANRAVSSDRLIEALWGDRGPSGALKRLQVAIARLRRALDAGGGQEESVLRTTAGGYLLAVAPGELDAEVFQARVEEGRRAHLAGDAPHAREVLREALELWRGPPLAEVAYEEFAQAEIRRLEELRLAALEARVETELELGEPAGLIGELEALVAAHPARERFAAQLMLALYRSGRQGDALEVFARARAYLSTELGLEPGPALQALQAEILAQSPALQPVAGEHGAAAAEQPARLPTGVVTFLLTDIEGSTRLWESDPDAMAAALELHDALIARVVEHHGGRLLKEKGEGDATLSVFHRASHSIACAAALQRELAAAYDAAPLQLRVRMALHSGEAQERDDDYFGPVVNRAARLRSLASGGQTVVSHTTTELVRDRLPPGLALVDIGLHELRGLSRPERVFELRAVAGDASSVSAGDVALPLPRSLHIPTDSPFVGRAGELERLRARWREVCAGTRSAVVMGGEAGIGKTRLASELAREVHAKGSVVLYGRCDEGLAVPYQPFVEALRPYVRAVGLDRLRAELGELAPELGRLLPEVTSLGDPVRADPESERFALFEAVAALLESATREQCMLLLVDDLHWAALPTLLLLRHLIRSERPLNVLLLGTYRETELDASHPLAQLLADLHRDASVQLASIRGLDEDAIASLLHATGNGLRDRAPDLAHLLWTETAGNPFFVRELLAHLVESGGISRAGRASAGRAELDVPERLRHVIRNRVGRLSKEAQRALRVAAVAGPTFSPGLLEAVLGEAPSVLDALDEAVAAGLLTEAGHGEHAFGHALVRQTLYRELGSARRMRLHSQLGEALEAAGAGQTRVELLAHHFAEAAGAGKADKAADYALAASRSASARLGYEEAVAHCERGLQALDVAGSGDDGRRCELLLTLGDACSNTGDIDRARRTCMRAADLAEEIGDERRLARAALGYCGPLFFHISAATSEPSVGLLQRALDRLGDDDVALRARLMGRLAAALAYADRQSRRPQLAREALQIARRDADRATLADVVATTYWSIRGPDSLEECLALTKELALLADEVGDVRLRTYAQQWLVDHLLELGEIEGVERELRALERRVEPLSKRHNLGWLLAVVRARHAHLGGRFEQAEAFAQEAVTHGFEGQDEPVAHTFGAQLLFLRREQGRLDEVAPAVKAFADLYPSMPAWCCALAWVYTELGRCQEAREVLDRLAREDFQDLPRDGLWLGTIATLAEVVARLDDVPRARLIYDLLLPFADRCIVLLSFTCEGSVGRALGLLATAMSRYDEAAGHFDAALTRNARIGSPLWVAHTQHDYARMLLRRGRPEDRDRARELLEEALAAAQAIGMTSLAKSVRPLRLGAPEGDEPVRP